MKANPTELVVGEINVTTELKVADQYPESTKICFYLFSHTSSDSKGALGVLLAFYAYGPTIVGGLSSSILILNFCFVVGCKAEIFLEG